MDSRTNWRLLLPAAQGPKLPQEDSLYQEDKETQKMISHYLFLADCLLSTETAQEKEEDESTAA